MDLPEYIEKAMQAKLAEVRLELQHDSEAMVVKALQKQQEALEMTQADLRQTKQELAEWKNKAAFFDSLRPVQHACRVVIPIHFVVLFCHVSILVSFVDPLACLKHV